jgi:hypothetical protein
VTLQPAGMRAAKMYRSVASLELNCSCRSVSCGHCNAADNIDGSHAFQKRALAPTLAQIVRLSRSSPYVSACGPNPLSHSAWPMSFAPMGSIRRETRLKHRSPLVRRHQGSLAVVFHNSRGSYHHWAWESSSVEDDLQVSLRTG